MGAYEFKVKFDGKGSSTLELVKPSGVKVKRTPIRKMVESITYDKPYVVPKLKAGQEEKFNQMVQGFVKGLDNLYGDK